MPLDLSLEEVSGVIRLLREVCDRWDDPRAWREHLLAGACRLLRGNVAMCLTDRGGGKPEHFGALAVECVVGVPPQMRQLVDPAVSQLRQRGYADVSQNVMPGMTALYGEIQRQGWVTAARSQITDEATYHAAPYYQNFRKQIDCDDYVVSIRLVDVPRRPEAISVDRPHGAPRFGEREVALLKLLHDELAPLIGLRLATEEHLSRDGLSRRLRQTLALLMEGRSEKEAAQALKLSARTVHEYVSMLYEHFEVSSRAELLAYFIQRQPVRRGKAPSPISTARAMRRA